MQVSTDKILISSWAMPGTALMGSKVTVTEWNTTLSVEMILPSQEPRELPKHCQHLVARLFGKLS